MLENSKKMGRPLANRSAGVVLIAGLVVAGPALAGGIYSWQTADGNVAFADDIKKVPARYRDAVELREKQPLSNYERFSSQHSDGTQRYQDQLAARLAYLQRLNAEAPADEAPLRPVGSATIRINGSEDQVLTVSGGDEDAPVIVESIRVRSAGQISSRHDTVVHQGDRTLAILRGRQEGELGGPTNVVEEDRELYR